MSEQKKGAANAPFSGVLAKLSEGVVPVPVLAFGAIAIVTLGIVAAVVHTPALYVIAGVFLATLLGYLIIELRGVDTQGPGVPVAGVVPPVKPRVELDTAQLRTLLEVAAELSAFVLFAEREVVQYPPHGEGDRDDLAEVGFIEKSERVVGLLGHLGRVPAARTATVEGEQVVGLLGQLWKMAKEDAPLEDRRDQLGRIRESFGYFAREAQLAAGAADTAIAKAERDRLVGEIFADGAALFLLVDREVLPYPHGGHEERNLDAAWYFKEKTASLAAKTGALSPLVAQETSGTAQKTVTRLQRVWELTLASEPLARRERERDAAKDEWRRFKELVEREP
jgi:hypothetical protein